jgi:hypothetical protein
VTAARGLSRRRLIKAGAVVGGAVWITPVIESVASRAAAASLPTCSCAGCVAGTRQAIGCGALSGGVDTTCSDGSTGSCDQTVEGFCVCDVQSPVPNSIVCTSSAECARTYGSGYHCVGGFGTSNVCIQQCCGTPRPIPQ